MKEGEEEEEAEEDDERRRRRKIKEWKADVENQVTPQSLYSPRSKKASWREMQVEMTNRLQIHGR